MHHPFAPVADPTSVPIFRIEAIRDLTPQKTVMNTRTGKKSMLTLYSALAFEVLTLPEGLVTTALARNDVCPNPAETAP
jgi:hypothetical protein